MKNKKGLKVDIKKRFKPGLSERFNLRNARKEARLYFIKGLYLYSINVKCSLCRSYTMKCNSKTSECPLKRFENSKVQGCFVWVKEVLGTKKVKFRIHNAERIFWSSEDNREARVQIRLLRERAKTLINWV